MLATSLGRWLASQRMRMSRLRRADAVLMHSTCLWMHLTISGTWRGKSGVQTDFQPLLTQLPFPSLWDGFQGLPEVPERAGRGREEAGPDMG